MRPDPEEPALAGPRIVIKNRTESRRAKRAPGANGLVPGLAGRGLDSLY